MTLAARISGLPVTQRRAFALVVLAAAGALTWVTVFKPLHSLLRSQDEWRAQVRKDLATKRGKAQIEAPLRAKLDALQTAPVWNTFLAAQSDDEAVEQLQRDLSALGNAAGLGPLAFVPLPKAERTDYTGYGVRLNAAMTSLQLKAFSDALRGSARFLRIERLTVVAPQTQIPDQNPPLNVSMDVFGYARHGSAPAGALKAIDPAEGRGRS